MTERAIEIIKLKERLRKLTAERDQEIVKLRDQEIHFKTIAQLYGLTRARVEQIYKREKRAEAAA